MKATFSARHWLQDEYNRRRERNPAFSLRAFAQLLEIPPGRLSEILNHKRPLTVDLANRVAERLALNPRLRRQLLEQVTLERQKAGRESQIRRRSDGGHGPEVKEQALTPAQFEQLSLDQFRLIADWYHFAILSLMEVSDFEPKVSWIARRLGISTIQTTSAVERLERLGLIERSEERWSLTHVNLATPSDIASAALRRSHKQTLDQAVRALAEVPVDQRDITSMTMAIDVKKIPLAKELIQQFRRSLCALLETDNKTEVYNLNIQLVPVTKLPTK